MPLRYFAFFAAGFFAVFSADATFGAAPPVAFLRRHSSSCFVRRAFCFLRRGESCGVDMLARVLAKPSPWRPAQVRNLGQVGALRELPG